MEPKKRLKALLEGYLSNRLTPTETDEFAGYVADPACAENLRDLLENAFREEAGIQMAGSRRDRLTQRILDQSPRSHPISRRPTGIRRLLPYAAAGIIVVGSFVWLLDKGLIGNKEHIATSPQQKLVNTEIPPGGNRATLTFADGTTIDLRELQEGIIIGDELTYTDGSEVLERGLDMPASLQFATLATPKGGTYQVTLPDGSRAWLNAESSLKYPLRFDGAERIVELTGEAYFEVQSTAETTRRPFKVITNGQIVEVLGTEFNISAYDDEKAVTTTLVKGSVRIHNGMSETTVLSPGEQAIIRGAKISVEAVDASRYTAWREGYFRFDSTPIDVVMRQLGRWYDIEIRFEGSIPNDRFEGEISRELTLQQVLNGLATTRINYHINGRTLTVTEQE